MIDTVTIKHSVNQKRNPQRVGDDQRTVEEQPTDNVQQTNAESKDQDLSAVSLASTGLFRTIGIAVSVPIAASLFQAFGGHSQESDAKGDPAAPLDVVKKPILVVFWACLAAALFGMLWFVVFATFNYRNISEWIRQEKFKKAKGAKAEAAMQREGAEGSSVHMQRRQTERS